MADNRNATSVEAAVSAAILRQAQATRLRQASSWQAAAATASRRSWLYAGRTVSHGGRACSACAALYAAS